MCALYPYIVLLLLAIKRYCCRNAVEMRCVSDSASQNAFCSWLSGWRNTRYWFTLSSRPPKVGYTASLLWISLKRDFCFPVDCHCHVVHANLLIHFTHAVIVTFSNRHTALLADLQACRGYEISHPYPYPYPQIFAWISMDISISTDA